MVYVRREVADFTPNGHYQNMFIRITRFEDRTCSGYSCGTKISVILPMHILLSHHNVAARFTSRDLQRLGSMVRKAICCNIGTSSIQASQTRLQPCQNHMTQISTAGNMDEAGRASLLANRELQRTRYELDYIEPEHQHD